MNSRVTLENLVLKKGIIKSHEKTTETLSELLLLNGLLTRKELNITARNLVIKNTHRLTLNSLSNLLRNFLFNKRLSDLGLNKLQERHR